MENQQQSQFHLDQIVRHRRLENRISQLSTQISYYFRDSLLRVKTFKIEFRKSPPRGPSVTPFDTASTASGEDIVRTVDIPIKCNDPKEPLACKTDEVCNVDTGSCLPSKDVKGTVETVNIKGATY